MTSSKTLLAACFAAFSLAGAAAAEPPDFGRPADFFAEGDLPLENGGVIKDFSIGYVTYGRLNAAKSNAILMVTAIGGNRSMSRVIFTVRSSNRSSRAGRRDTSRQRV